MKRVAYLIAATALGVGALAQTAAAQQPVTQIIGGTTITLGGGAQLLSLPDLDFTFKVNEEGAAVRKQTKATSTITAKHSWARSRRRLVIGEALR